jgi:hypothetical protein
MEQILEHLLAEIRTNREEMRTIQVKIEINQEKMEAKMDTNQEMIDGRQEEMKAQVASLASWINANQQELKIMLDARLEKMEANAGELQSVLVHQEVPKEKAAVETIGALEDQHLAIRRCQQLKKWTQGDGGSQKKLAATRRQMRCCAIPALHKGHGHQGPGKDDDVCGTPKGWTFKKIHQA